MTKIILGHIDCPTCGTAKGLRITHDKNGDPFGFCEATCNQQIRIGGDKRRVAAFLARHPWAAPAAAAAPVTDTAPAAPPSKAKPAAPPVPVPAPARKPIANPFDFLLNPKA